MSIRCQNWVYEYSEATGNERLVLLAIADEAEDDGTNAHPGIDRISHKARVPKRTTMACLARLEEAGYIIVERPKRRGRGHYNTYRVVMEVQQPTGPWSTGPDALTPSRRLAFIAAVEEKVCAYCNGSGNDEVGPDGEAWQVDRVVPGSKGGTYVLSNMALSCSDCNRRKKDQDVAVFLARKGAGTAPRTDALDPEVKEKETVQEGREKARNGAPHYLTRDRPFDPGIHPPDLNTRGDDDAPPPEPRAGVEVQDQGLGDQLLAAVAVAAPAHHRFELLDDPDQAAGRAALRHRLVLLDALVGFPAAVAVVAGDWPPSVSSAMAHANARARAFLDGPGRRPAESDPLDGIAAATKAIAERNHQRQAELATAPTLAEAGSRPDFAAVKAQLQGLSS